MSDKGDKYNDLGMLGSYRTSEVQFPNPKGVKTFSGYGADEADLELGFIRPAVRELPNYDKINYAQRSTNQKMPDEDDTAGSYSGFLGLDAKQRDFDFREEKRTAKGLFTRPYIPTDR